jgi:hypothetical protein
VYRASLGSAWSVRKFKFADADMRGDTAFFDTFLVDRRGMRNYWELRQLDNRFEITTFKEKQPGRPANTFSVGARHALINLHQEPADSVFSNVFLTGRLAITPSDRFALVGRGDLGMLNNFGEYLVESSLQLGLGKLGSLRGYLLSQRRPPGMLHHRLYVSKQLFWQNDFEKPVETSLSASYRVPGLPLEIEGQTHLVNNYLYYDQQGLAKQTTEPLSVSQLSGIFNFTVKKVWHIDNTVALQRTNREDVLRLPTWFYKNSLYFGGKVFRHRLDLSMGWDFRINSAFTPDGWQPLTNQFHLQDELRQEIYPWVDVFLAMKVQSFRLYFRWENLYNIIDPSQVYYQTAWHPSQFSSFRLGITWQFIDDNRPGAASTTPSAPPPGTTLGN